MTTFIMILFVVCLRKGKGDPSDQSWRVTASPEEHTLNQGAEKQLVAPEKVGEGRKRALNSKLSITSEHPR